MSVPSNYFNSSSSASSAASSNTDIPDLNLIGGVWPRAFYVYPPLVAPYMYRFGVVFISWLVTLTAVAIIYFRIWAIQFRHGRLFGEDMIVIGSVPVLVIRMILATAVLRVGTNNVRGLDGIDSHDIRGRIWGSQVVIITRICYTAYIWMNKLAIAYFFRRLTAGMWSRTMQVTLRLCQLSIMASFVVIVVVTLCECRPLSRSWQVKPDPGPRCRQGYGHMIFMTVFDTSTDLLLAALPVPVLLASGMPLRSKVVSISLLSLTGVLIVVTAIRCPLIIANLGAQPYRTIWATASIGASTILTNAVPIGAFIRFGLWSDTSPFACARRRNARKRRLEMDSQHYFARHTKSLFPADRVEEKCRQRMVCPMNWWRKGSEFSIPVPSMLADQRVTVDGAAVDVPAPPYPEGEAEQGRDRGDVGENGTPNAGYDIGHHQDDRSGSHAEGSLSKTESADQTSTANTQPTTIQRPMTALRRQWGSDEDLVRSVGGMSLPPGLWAK